jgi:hypothetical protein
MVQSRGRPAMSALSYALCQSGRGQRDSLDRVASPADRPACAGAGDSLSLAGMHLGS